MPAARAHAAHGIVALDELGVAWDPPELVPAEMMKKRSTTIHKKSLCCSLLRTSLLRFQTHFFFFRHCFGLPLVRRRLCQESREIPAERRRQGRGFLAGRPAGPQIIIVARPSSLSG